MGDNNVEKGKEDVTKWNIFKGQVLITLHSDERGDNENLGPC